MVTLSTVLFIIITYIYTFVHGFHDGCNVVATIVASRSMSPKKALVIATITEFLSPLILGTAVAATIGKGIVDNKYILSKGTGSAYVFLFCAILAAIAWNLITWWFALPSSSSHALIGGVMGSGICAFGFSSIQWANILLKVILILAITPILGFIVGFLVMMLTNRACRNCSKGINQFFKKSQTFSMVFLAASHGTNDSQISMGIVALVLMISGIQDGFLIPFWVKIASAALMALGLYLGGWKIVKTVGGGIFRIKPVHSFVSQLSAALVIFVSGQMGFPVSTSQIVSSSIAGVGSAEKINAVKWSVVKNIIISWVITIPAAASIAALIYFMTTLF